MGYPNYRNIHYDPPPRNLQVGYVYVLLVGIVCSILQFHNTNT